MDSGNGKIAKIIPTIALFLSLPLAAQTLVNPAFEVATVRPSVPDARGGGRTITDTRVDIRNTSLFQVLLEAYQVDAYRRRTELAQGKTLRYSGHDPGRSDPGAGPTDAAIVAG